MSKSHRDNHKARVKRGPVAFAKKAKRRAPKPKCHICGRERRFHKCQIALCPTAAKDVAHV